MDKGLCIRSALHLSLACMWRRGGANSTANRIRPTLHPCGGAPGALQPGRSQLGPWTTRDHDDLTSAQKANVDWLMDTSQEFLTFEMSQPAQSRDPERRRHTGKGEGGASDGQLFVTKRSEERDRQIAVFCLFCGQGSALIDNCATSGWFHWPSATLRCAASPVAVRLHIPGCGYAPSP